MQPLAHLYSSLILETLRRMPNTSLTFILRLHDSVTMVSLPSPTIIVYSCTCMDTNYNNNNNVYKQDIDEQSSKEVLLQKVKEQTIIQFLIETLAKLMVTDSDLYQEVVIVALQLAF